MRSAKFCLLLAAALALTASAAHAASLTISPGGSITAAKELAITHYQLTVSPYPLWISVGTRTCTVTFGGTAHTGPILDQETLIELDSGSASGCSDPATPTFAAGPWTLTAWERSARRAYLERAQISMPVDGVTCDYDGTGRRVIGTITDSPILVDGALVTSWDTSFWAGVATSYIYSAPRSATCGAIRVDIGGGPLRISPGQTITLNP